MEKVTTSACLFFVTPPISDFTTFLIRKMNIKHYSTEKKAHGGTTSNRKNSLTVFLPLVILVYLSIGWIYLIC